MTRTATKTLLKNSVFGAAMVMALSACVPGDNASNEMQRDIEFTQAQSQFYANAIQEYSMRSQHALTNNAAWASGGVSEGLLDLTSTDFGSLDLGAAEVFVTSAYCKESATDALHITWFDTRDENGDFALKGIGAGNAGFVMSAIQEQTSMEGVGLYEAGAINMLDNTTLNLPTGCAGLNIPNNAPIIVTNVSLPQGTSNDTQRYEYRTVSCPSGEEGFIQQQVLVRYLADGSRHPMGGRVYGAMENVNFAEMDTLTWMTVSHTCSEEAVDMTSYESTALEVTDFGVEFNALLTASGSTGGDVSNIINDNMASIECRQLMDSVQNGGTATGDEIFQTCGSSVDLAAVASIGAVSYELTETEEVTLPCGGQAGTFEDSVDGDIGIATHPMWTGTQVLRRDTYTYSVSLTGQGPGPGCSDCEETKSRDVWTGISIECSREEVLTIACDTRITDYTDTNVFTVLTSGGFRYNRVNNVSGWAVPSELVPNDPDNPTWTGLDFDCSWRKNVDFDCSAADETANLRQVRAGAATRDIEVGNISGDVIIGDWNVSTTAQCAEDFTWDCSGQAGYTQTRAGSAVKITDVVDPDGNINVGDLQIQQTAQCEKTREFTCPAGTLIQTGMQRNVLEILNPAGDTSGGDWATTQNSSCRDTRTVGGCEQRTERRTYTGTAPGQGSWSGWTTVSTVNNCNPTVPTFSGGSGGGGGDGGDVCIMAGAKVVMADGTTKNIENLEVGDVTVAGRVLQKFARHYNENRHMTAEGRMLIGDSLYNVDGIVATGRHAYLGREGWVELSDSVDANAVNEDVSMLYNLVMEHHIIPVEGDSGKLYYYADELNNLGGVAEKAVNRIFAAEVSVQQMAA